VNFLNVGPWELTVILIIAILVVGPKRMVEIARTIGRTTSQMRKLSSEFLGTIQAELQATEQETQRALKDITKAGQESIASIPGEVQSTEQETRQALESVAEKSQAATISIQDGLQAVEHETRQAMKEVVESVESIIKGEPETKDRQDEEASTDGSG
jgi:sec-independent protein translocase protein TatB